MKPVIEDFCSIKIILKAPTNPTDLSSYKKFYGFCKYTLEENVLTIKDFDGFNFGNFSKKIVYNFEEIVSFKVTPFEKLVEGKYLVGQKDEENIVKWIKHNLTSELTTNLSEAAIFTIDGLKLVKNPKKCFKFELKNLRTLHLDFSDIKNLKILRNLAGNNFEEI
jgi:hypothetical protein